MKKMLCLFACLFICVFLCSCSDLSNDSIESVDPATDKNNPVSENDNSTDDSLVLVDDDYVKVSYLGSQETLGIVGVQVNMRVENKTDKKIWVYLSDAQLDDEMVPLVMSGMPCYVNPNAKAGAAFIFPINDNMLIKSIDDVNSLTFVINVAEEETLNEIEKTDSFKINK